MDYLVLQQVWSSLSVWYNLCQTILIKHSYKIPLKLSKKVWSFLVHFFLFSPWINTIKVIECELLFQEVANTYIVQWACKAPKRPSSLMLKVKCGIVGYFILFSFCNICFYFPILLFVLIFIFVYYYLFYFLFQTLLI